MRRPRADRARWRPARPPRGLRAAGARTRRPPAPQARRHVDRRDRHRHRAPAAEGADPRDGGFEVALGEWAVTPEAQAIRPGRATFVIVNRGTVPHGFEIEREDVERRRGARSRPASSQPGESVEVELDLEAGVYKLECNVDGHDDMGMEMLLEVSRGRAAQPEAAAPQAGGTAARSPSRPSRSRPRPSPPRSDSRSPGRTTTRPSTPSPRRAAPSTRGRWPPERSLRDHLRQPRRVPLHLRAPSGHEGDGGGRGVASSTERPRSDRLLGERP